MILIKSLIISSSMGLVIIGSNQKDSRCLSSWVLASRFWMMADFSLLKLDLFTKSWNLQEWSIVVNFQHTSCLRHILGHIIMGLRLREVEPSHMDFS